MSQCIFFVEPPVLLLVLVSPVHIGGSSGSPKNYRPVALTSHLISVFDRVFRKVLVCHLEKQGHLSDSQHGIHIPINCDSTSILLGHHVGGHGDGEGKAVDFIYTDFSKASQSTSGL